MPTQRLPRPAQAAHRPATLSGAFLLVTGLPAQSVAPPSPPAELSQQPVELSPFVVQAADEGWLAGNIMLSSRTNQPLRDVPP